MPSPALPNVRVVVRLSENRPETPLPDPPKIEWNQEKADILWKVIERSRTKDSGGTDWKGLAAHLEVPLPYLLYRAHARFQEDLRGLQDISVSSPSSTQPPTSALEEFPLHNDQLSNIHGKNRLSGSIRLSSSSARTSTPLGIRARLNSLGHNSHSHNTPRPKKATSSSSTLTLQQPQRPASHFRPRTPTSSEGETDSDDEEMLKEEEAERHAEEQEALEKKLKDLQRMMTNEALGLVSSNRNKRKSVDRGRMFSPKSSYRQDGLSSASASHSVSSASSPQGSIPEIPSPPPDSQPHSPIGRHMSPGKSSSPPALSPRSALSQSHRRYGHLMGRSSSEQDSVNGSEASSFSDISDASLSGSALESALLSNIRGGGSRFSAFTRSRFAGGRSGIPL
ncbi:autophagy-related protein 29 [Moniliophthora roreri MCA 2997]|uniref:Autophagy-related protein 29 n=1 Tax=Moniliophthora roreri (strain MCA 2997) TaxID=1381753 RepID=V2X3C7_MONRO|nr:autophagy-related protein 29 [Moniliophthora roreri MCA 2997]